MIDPLKSFQQKNWIYCNGNGYFYERKGNEISLLQILIWLKYTDSGFKKSSFGSQNKIPIFNRKIRNLMISHTLLSQSIHRLIKHYSILVIIQMSQYSTYWRVKIGDWPILTLWWVETVIVFWQILCFGELINRFWKSSPNLEGIVNAVCRIHALHAFCQSSNEGNIHIPFKTNMIRALFEENT